MLERQDLLKSSAQTENLADDFFARIPESGIEKDTIQFEGFSEEQEKWVRGALDVIGMPLTNIKTIQASPNGEENANWMGSINYNEGKITLYTDRLGKNDIDALEVLATIIHEQVHNASSFNDNNDALYGGREQREGVKDYYYDVAQQTVVTRVPLNKYHSNLMHEMERGEITVGRYLRETEAIASEMRVKDGEKLAKVQTEQYIALMELQMKGDEQAVGLKFTPLTSRDIHKPKGADNALIALFDGVEDSVSYQARLDRIHEFAQTHPNPFRKDDGGRLANGFFTNSYIYAN